MWSASWDKKTLSELAKEFVNGGTPSTKVTEYWGNDIPWLTGADINSLRVSEGRKRVTAAALKNSSTHLVPENTVLLVTRTSVGKVAVSSNPLCFSQDITGIKCREMIRPAYLARFLSSIQSSLVSRVRGSTIKGLAREDFEGISVPVPPLEIQRRIEDVLDRIDTIRTKRERANQLANTIIQSTYLKMFGDPSINPKAWKIVTIADIVTETQYGISKSLDDNPVHVPILRMNNVTMDGYIDTNKVRFVDINSSVFEKYRLNKGDILFNRTNSRELVGKTGLVTTQQDFVFASYLIRVKTKPKMATTEYVWSFLNSAYGKEILLRTARGAVGQANINSQELHAMQIPLPPIQLQEKFSLILQKLEPVKTTQIRSSREINTLFHSMLYKAFV